jgi:hypothetical protein
MLMNLARRICLSVLVALALAASVSYADTAFAFTDHCEQLSAADTVSAQPVTVEAHIDTLSENFGRMPDEAFLTDRLDTETNSAMVLAFATERPLERYDKTLRL